MKNNLLTQCITKLDRKGLTRFNEFARSPYFNKHKDVAGLVSYFSDIYPNFTEKNVIDKLFTVTYTLPSNMIKRNWL